MLTTQEVDACTAMKEIADLLPSDFFGRKADTLFHDTVVGGEDDVLGMLKGRS